MEGVYAEAAKEITKMVVKRPLDQLKLAWRIKDQLNKLKQEFIYVQAFLQDVSSSNPHHRSGLGNTQVLNAWLKKVMELAYSTDDVIDDYAFQTLGKRCRKVMNKVKVNDQPRSKVLRSLPSCGFKMSRSVGFRFRMSRKVEGILRSFDSLYKDAARLGIRPAEIEMETNSVIRKGAVDESLDEVRELAVVHRSEFVGRERDQNELVRLICDFDDGVEEISAVAIVGMGGLGKTTLARQLYSNTEVTEHFIERFWICVSDNFTVKRILREMFERLTGGKCELSNTDDIINKIEQFLRGKIYLLVLDDVWLQNQNNWNSLTNCLLRIGGSAGRTILITTRSKDTARIVECRYIHELTGLTDEESWVFFLQKAFPKGVGVYDPEYKEIGRRIVRKCDGLPLAINVMGGLLRMKTGITEWKSVERSKMWDLPQENNDIIPSLLLSFNNLPSPSLKQCFAYCAFFPNDALIDRDDLINLWNAQGFLNDNHSEGPEELGSMYFDILLNNSLLQAETRHSFDGVVTLYHMHYLVHDLALYVSKHESDFRYLGETREFPFPAEKMKKLRTLQSFVKLPKDDLLMHASKLRILKLVAIGLEKVPPGVVRFRHLRYLDLSRNSIVTLPEWITKLYHLQTFRLFSHKLKELPKSLCRLLNLRHLYLTSRSWCVPRGIQFLSDLQTVPMLELMEDQGWKISELSTLSNIKGLLSISGLEHVNIKADAEKAAISQKNISELQLIWGRGSVDNHFDVLDSLKPNQNIKLLMITGYDSPKFPPWISDTPFYNLIQVELLYCESCQHLPTLGYLPCLRELSMYSLCSVEFIGNEFYHSDDNNNLPPVLFPSLRILIISSFEILKEWSAPVPEDQTNVFPMLETLKIEYCQELIQTPTNFPSLKHLRVNNSLRGSTLCNVINGSMNALSSFDINDAADLVSLPDCLTDCTTLEEIKLRTCPRLQGMPDSLGRRLLLLNRFTVATCPDLINIPTGIGECRSLRRVCIHECVNLESVPDLTQLVHVEEVKITGCPKLRSLPSGLHTVPNLNSLSIGGLMSLNIDISLSDVIFPGLKMLRIVGDDCAEKVPEWTQNIPLLQKMERKWCKKLKSLIKLTRLTSLVISSCPLLQERCVRDGPEWSNISHIRFISINSKTIQETVT